MKGTPNDMNEFCNDKNGHNVSLALGTRGRHSWQANHTMNCNDSTLLAGQDANDDNANRRFT